MKKFRTLLIGLTLIFVVFGGAYQLFFSNDVGSSKFSNLMNLEKSKFGGVVYNDTNHNIKITDWKLVSILSPGMSSRDIGIFDADSVIVDRPTVFLGKKYSYGIIKICDCSSIRAVEKDGVQKFVPSASYGICKLFKDSGWFASLDTVFRVLPEVNLKR